MSDLKPLRESKRDGFTQGLLDSAFLDEPPRRSLRRTAAFLGVSEAAAAALASSSASAATAGIVGTGAGTLSAGAASGGKAALLVALKWLGAGALVGATTAGGIDYLSTDAPPSGRAATPTVVSRGTATESVKPTPKPVAAEPAPVERQAEEQETPTARDSVLKGRAASAPAPAAAVESSVRETPGLDGEIRRLDRARAALSRGSAEGALAELAAYESERKTAVLEREALVLRVDALLAQGNREGARSLARSYVTAHPDDPHARRLRKLLEPENERP